MKSVGYWVFDVNVVEEMPPMVESEAGSIGDAPTYNAQTVFKKVTVDTDLGAAYYPQREIGPDADIYNLRKRGGRVFVPVAQVHRTPPNRAKPYHEVVDE